MVIRWVAIVVSRVPPMQDLTGRERLEKFIDDCGLLGPVRFVCMTDGAILEAVGSFDNIRYSDLPKGR